LLEAQRSSNNPFERRRDEKGPEVPGQGVKLRRGLDRPGAGAKGVTVKREQACDEEKPTCKVWKKKGEKRGMKKSRGRKKPRMRESGGRGFQ